ncbi:hypothetical protein BQ6471_02407 [Vibrio gazogenes]|nr:hypothetical protein BQ6471_02407 [Vibrio gazogenes]
MPIQPEIVDEFGKSTASRPANNRPVQRSHHDAPPDSHPTDPTKSQPVELPHLPVAAHKPGAANDLNRPPVKPSGQPCHSGLTGKHPTRYKSPAPCNPANDGVTRLLILPQNPHRIVQRLPPHNNPPVVALRPPSQVLQPPHLQYRHNPASATRFHPTRFGIPES